MTVWTIINCQCGSLPVLITGTGAVVVSWGGYYIIIIYYYFCFFTKGRRWCLGVGTVPVTVYLYGYFIFSPFLLPVVRTRGETRRRSKIPCMQFVKDNFASCINFHCNYPFFVCVHISTKRNTALICTHFHGAETVCAASIIGAAIYISLINRAASGFAPLMMLLAVSFYIKLCNNNNNILLLSF